MEATTPTTPDAHVSEITTAIHTPAVTKSKIIKVCAVIFLFIVFVIAMIIKYNHRTSAKSPESSSFDNSPKYDLSYNLLDIDYGDSIVFQLKPGQTARVELVNDGWCPNKSSSRVDTYNDKGEKSVLLGNRYVQGSPTSTDNSYRVYVNTGNNLVTIKTGKFKKEDYPSVQF